MAEHSISFDGEPWQDNDKLVEWQCSRCGGLFTARDEAQKHLETEHAVGTLFPKLNANGWQMIFALSPNIKKNSEPDILGKMGFHSTAIGNIDRRDDAPKKSDKKKRAARTDVKKRVAFALWYLEVNGSPNRTAAARKAHTSTTSINKYEDNKDVIAQLDRFRKNKNERDRFRQSLANLNLRKSR